MKGTALVIDEYHVVVPRKYSRLVSRVGCSIGVFLFSDNFIINLCLPYLSNNSLGKRLAYIIPVRASCQLRNLTLCYSGKISVFETLLFMVSSAQVHINS